MNLKAIKNCENYQNLVQINILSNYKYKLRESIL